MSVEPLHLRFLRQARRRWLAWRVVESAGLCVAGTAGLGMLVVPVLVWRGQPAILMAASLLSIGALGGIIWALSQRPTLAKIANLIDRELGLHDLLGTAVTSGHCEDEVFRTAVLAQADLIARQYSPSQLVFRRLGGRAWSGIGIISALLLTLSMMSGRPDVSDARVINAERVSGFRESRSEAKENAIALPRPSAMQKASSAVDQRLAEGSGDIQEDPARVMGQESQTGNSLTQISNGSGSAQGRSADASSSTLHEPAHATQSNESGTIPASGGLGSTAGSAGVSNSSATEIPSKHLVPPWQSDRWPADRAQAIQRLQSGDFPAEYRDLVRDYFDRDMP